MFNLVVLTGRLTADPELRYTTNNIPVTSFSIAVNRRYKAGEESQADFINIVAWRQTAEFVTKYFKKGSMIGIEGAIQTRKYVDKDTGKNRTAFEVIANNVQFVESRRDDAGAGNQAAPSFNNTDSGEFAEIAADDDLPF
ncbi:MAG: single-stranded DNA-binding protein [Clostridia bacterium]|nr:single-stranded DNA-binding protein [Clostridia bacterium]MBR3594302.1 single-stranded DNA-binding protein [Clostridia bacterium]